MGIVSDILQEWRSYPPRVDHTDFLNGYGELLAAGWQTNYWESLIKTLA